MGEERIILKYISCGQQIQNLSIVAKTPPRAPSASRLLVKPSSINGPLSLESVATGLVATWVAVTGIVASRAYSH